LTSVISRLMVAPRSSESPMAATRRRKGSV